MSARRKQKDYKSNCKILNTKVRVKKQVWMSLKKEACELTAIFESVCSRTKERNYHFLATQNHISWLEPVFSVVLKNHKYFREEEINRNKQMKDKGKYFFYNNPSNQPHPNINKIIQNVSMVCPLYLPYISMNNVIHSHYKIFWLCLIFSVIIRT